MKIYLQVIDTKTGIYQTGMIDEPTYPGFEMKNALAHFGVLDSEVQYLFKDENFFNGIVPNTTKVFLGFINKN